MTTTLERFEIKYEPEPNSGCWLWISSSIGNGYGSFYVSRNKVSLAHRYSYETFVGPIPEGLDLDHLCRVRSCVNPKHLEPVTRRENLLRGDTIPAMRAAQTHCVNGHPFDEYNTIIRRGNRECRECVRKMKRVAWHRQTLEQRDKYNRRRQELRRIARG